MHFFIKKKTNVEWQGFIGEYELIHHSRLWCALMQKGQYTHLFEK